jgi:hypothetical protein
VYLLVLVVDNMIQQQVAAAAPLRRSKRYESLVATRLIHYQLVKSRSRDCRCMICSGKGQPDPEELSLNHRQVQVEDEEHQSMR